MKILGIDLGKSRTGVSMCDIRVKLATPVEIIREKDEKNFF